MGMNDDPLLRHINEFAKTMEDLAQSGAMDKTMAVRQVGELHREFVILWDLYRNSGLDLPDLERKFDAVRKDLDYLRSLLQ